MRALIVTLALAVGAASLAVIPTDADARRFGGGKISGFQRKLPPKQVNPAPKPAQTPDAQKAPTAAAAGTGAAANAGRRSWMGPIAGLAAGLGLAALFSHLGFGEGLANIVTMLLLAVVGIWLVRMLMRKFAGAGSAGRPAMAGAGAGAGSGLGLGPAPGGPGRAPGGVAPYETGPTRADVIGAERRAMGEGAAAGAAAGATGPSAGPAAPSASTALPEGVDEADFLRIAKQVFIRLQAANDSGDIDDLRRFTTPELFASVKADLLERGQTGQQTDVVQLDAAIADTSAEAGRDIVSVRFSGLIREERESGAEPFDELWHLERGADGNWLIAGIQPLN